MNVFRLHTFCFTPWIKVVVEGMALSATQEAFLGKILGMWLCDPPRLESHSGRGAASYPSPHTPPAAAVPPIIALALRPALALQPQLQHRSARRVVGARSALPRPAGAGMMLMGCRPLPVGFSARQHIPRPSCRPRQRAPRTHTSLVCCLFMQIRGAQGAVFWCFQPP